MIFYKTVSAGNDFIHIEVPRKPRQASMVRQRLAIRITCRHRGAGADGVVFYHVDGGRVFCDIYNRDGSRAEISGNGLSGLAAVLFFTRRFAGRVGVQTQIGCREVVQIDGRGHRFRLRVEIGVPDFVNRRFFPFIRDGQAGYRLRETVFYPVSVGNPHAVVTDGSHGSQEELQSLAQRLAKSDLFPLGVNVEIITALQKGHCAVYFHERGVGPTHSSSTGSAAVLAVLNRLGKAGGSLRVKTPSQELAVDGKERIWIENLTEIVYKGIYQP